MAFKSCKDISSPLSGVSLQAVWETARQRKLGPGSGLDVRSLREYSLAKTPMVTTHRFSRRFWIIAGIAILFAIGALIYFLTPPVFVQAGNHYFGGPDLTRVGGVYRCDPVGQENCTVTRESLIAAIANDPNLVHWWPVRMEFLTFE